MKVTDYIKVYDNFLRPETVSSLLIWLTKQEFEKAKIIGNGHELVEEKVRKTETFDFNLKRESSQTQIHWFNYIASKLTQYIQRYENDVCKFDRTCTFGLKDLMALKYVESGFYDFHTDHHPTNARTLSCIILLNNDYEGGELEFGSSFDHSSILKIEPKVGRLIIWPSNFMFPHRVNPVTKKTRYSLVSWVY